LLFSRQGLTVLALNSPSSCLSLLNAKMTGIHTPHLAKT
jgi:hypothetical protein